MTSTDSTFYELTNAKWGEAEKESDDKFGFLHETNTLGEGYFNK